MKLLKVVAALWAGAAVLVVPAAAQDEAPQQTRETARVFLSTLAKTGSISLAQRGQRWSFRNIALTDVEQTGDNSCMLNLVLGPYEHRAFARRAYRSGGGDMFLDEWSDIANFIYPTGAERNRVYFDGSGTSRDFGYYQNEYTIYGYAGGKAPIDFTRVSKVDRYGSSVTVRSQYSTFTLVLPTEDLATRMTFALEFMRMNCDPTAGLAF
jgi:hypothetical protein